MAKPSLKTIVDELIALEPSLKEHRKELEKSIKAIVEAKPDTKFTNAFKQKLLKELQAAVSAQPESTSLSPMQTMQKLLYAIGGAAVASIGLYITVINPAVPLPTDGEDDYDGGSVAMQDQNMMGNRMMNTAMPTDGNYVEHGEDAMGMPMEEYYEGGRAGGGGGYGIMDSRMMIAPGEPMPPYRQTRYVYDGTIELPETDTIEVFRRNRLNASSANGDLLQGTFVSDLMDVSQLAALNVTSISLAERGDEPLYVNVDFQEGTIGMHRQINYGNRPESNCRDQACFDRFRLKERDMLSDSRAIEIANEFLQDLGVDTADYGEPMLQDNWRMRYETTADKASFYFPEQMSVTYPYTVNGMPVYDEWGNANGLSVNVDVRLRAATNMWGLRVTNYETEEMEAVSDPELVREFMNMANGYAPPETETVDATLGDPRMVYVSHYTWDEETQEGYEVYLPALGFPVTEMPEDSYEFRKMVVVPLSQSILQERLEQMPPEGGPMPMPMPVEPLKDPAAPPPPATEPPMMEGQAG